MDAHAADEAATPKTPANARAYVILKSDDNQGLWQPVATVESASARAAVQAAAAPSEDGKPRYYVAVPARNWRPVKATLTTSVSVRLVAA